MPTGHRVPVISSWPAKDRKPMSGQALVRRWRYPAALIFLLGGFLGAALNLGVTLLLALKFSWDPLAAFFIGTFLNQAFHYFYYNVVYVNREIRMRTSPPLHFLLIFLVSMGSSALLWFFLRHEGFPLPAALVACLGILAL